MRKKLTTSEKIRNAVACQEVENLHARHCFMHCAGRNIEEIDNYWSHDPGVSWGHAFGKWTSWTGVKFGWGGSLERKGTLAFLQLTQVWPQIAGLDPRPIQESAIHMLATDIIEVAADGKTARAYFYTPGAICSMLNTNRQRKCFLMWERYGIEYVCEDGHSGLPGYHGAHGHGKPCGQQLSGACRQGGSRPRSCCWKRAACRRRWPQRSDP